MSNRVDLERFITRGIDEKTRARDRRPPAGARRARPPIEDPVPLRLADVGEHPRSYGFPPGHPPMGNFLGVPIVIRGQAWGNLYLTEKPGGDFDEADEQTALVLAEWTAIAVDNARLYADVGKQRDSLERAVRGLEATTEITRAVGGETDLEPDPRDDRQAGPGPGRGTLAVDPARGRAASCEWPRLPGSSRITRICA